MQLIIYKFLDHKNIKFDTQIYLLHIVYSGIEWKNYIKYKLKMRVNY